MGKSFIDYLKHEVLVPFLGLLGDYQVMEEISLFGTWQFATFVELDTWKTNFQPAIDVNFTHTEAIGTFIEVYSDIPLDSGQVASVFDVGIVWLPRENLQLDFNFGVSLDDHRKNFVGIGIAVLY